ncbi:MAG: DNA polymerase IV, partial [Flavobacteriales bacterium]
WRSASPPSWPSTCTRQARISYTSCDHTLIAVALGLFDKLYDRRVLVRLVGLRFSHLVGGGYQINLFEDTQEMLNLYAAMDRVRKRFGRHAVKRAVTMASKNIGRENPFNKQAPVIPARRRA